MKKITTSFVIQTTNENRKRVSELLRVFKPDHKLLVYCNAFYGIDVENQVIISEALSMENELKTQGFQFLTINQAEQLYLPSNASKYDTGEIEMKVVRSKEVTIKGTTDKRTITIMVAIVDDIIRTGYSVRMPNDTDNPTLAETIAKGRALNNRTNLTPDMICGIGMNKKYILYAIADHWLKVITNGGLEIKGITKSKK